MKLGIKNFRSLKNTGDVEIKPITILIGRNSSGKSSFLRTFPMLKQSAQEKTTSPILLYGNYVDFGSYNDIKPHFLGSNNAEEQYELNFTLNNKYLMQLPSFYRFRNEFREIGKEMEFKYSLKLNENKNQLIQISSIRFEMLENVLEFKLEHDSKKISLVRLNGIKYFDISDNLMFQDDGEFDVHIFEDKKDKRHTDSFSNIIKNKIIHIISRYVTKNTEKDTMWSVFEKIHFGTDVEVLEDIKKISYPTTWKKKTESWDKQTKDFIELKNYVFIYDFLTLYSNPINIYLKNIFLNMHYIAPLRATAERYYRIQHLAVDEVDPNGKNLPVFLGSLSENQLNDFQKWTNSNFGFKTKIVKIEGHYSIKIVHEDLHEINLSDMGFGYSQILPILTQIWHSISKKHNRRRSIFNNNYLEKIIVIEQPELHLHPEFQARFSDALAKVVTYSKEINIPIRFIIETHSDIMINRLGDCVLKEIISNEDINIVVFNKESEISSTEISISKFDKEGNLLNWPLGFFTPTI